MSVDPRLHKLLGGDALAALRRRLRRHFETADAADPPTRLRLGALNAKEREALASWTGRPPRDAASMQIDLNEIDTRLRAAGLAGSLREALEHLDGPIVHTASVRAANAAAWSAVLASCSHAGLSAHLQSPVAQGVLKRLARQNPSVATQLLQRAALVLHRLPTQGMPRAQLAAETLGDAHALDNGQATATLVLAAWRQMERSSGDTNVDDSTQVPPAEPAAGGETPLLESTPDERVRDVWARAGVLVNELARPALLLNVPAEREQPAVCPPGEPAYLSLRRLLRTPVRWAVAGETVFICENPNLVAIAADRLGSRCRPLVCTDGMPATGQRVLLDQLRELGAQLRYHGDFDWPGLQIANHVLRSCGAQPWRFATADYEAAVAAAPLARHDLPDSLVTASWDPALAPSMRRHGRAIAEEALADSLLRDLEQG